MATLEKGYSQDQFEQNYPAGNEQMWWIQARHRVVLRYLRLSGGDKMTVLDFGCGTGSTVRLLRGAGIDCYGCELSPAPIAPDVRSYIMSPADVLDLPREIRERTRTILALDVLEHMMDPKQLLRSLKQAYPNLEHVLCTLPARKELWSNYDTYFGHYRRFSRSTAKTLLQEAGYRVSYAGYFFHLLYIPFWLAIRWRKERSLHTPPPKYRVLDGLLAWFCALEERVIPGSWVGTSVFVMAVPEHE